MKKPFAETSKSYSIRISEIDILPVRPQGGLVAFASCVINDALFLGNVAIHSRLDGSGFRLVYPVKVLPNGKQIHCVHPVTWEAGKLLEEAVIQRFQELIEMAKKTENVTTMLKESGGLHGYNSRVH